MANIKNIEVVFRPGVVVYVTIRRLLDGFLLNDATGLFVTPAPADFFVSLSANANQPSLYRLAESRSAWQDGTYLVIAYRRSGGAVSIASDLPIGSAYMVISKDQEQFISSFTDSSASSIAQIREDISGFFSKLMALLKAVLKNTDVLVVSQENEARRSREKK